MAGLRFTLISDGSSDRAFLPLLKWVLNRNGVRFDVTGDWADWGRFRNPPKSLAKKVESAVQLYPCDLLFIHRDAEGEDPTRRREEIRRALEGVDIPIPPSVCLVPVRMMEAWFLFSEQAIREASGNPNGAGNLGIPRVRDLEALPDPKAALNQLLRDSSGLSGRRLKGFRAAAAIHRMAEIIDDFSPLLALPAFRALDDEVQIMAQQQGWQSD